MKKLAFFFFYVFVANAAGAADLPSLGDSEDSIVSKIDRRQLGKAIMYRLRNSDRYLDDPEIEGYINRIGYRLVSNSPVASEPIEFFVINDRSVNAFALPGGFIGVHTGLIQKVRSESELASVLAHEIAHVSQRHIARMIASQKRTGMASMAALAVAILASRSSGSASAAAITAAQAGLIQNKLNFSREYEREADRIGLKIIRNSSFDEHAVESFLKFMQRTTESSVAGAPSYMRTHPFFYERLADIQNRLQNAPYKQIPDSIDFKLVRARIEAQTDFPKKSVEHFKNKLSQKNYTSELATAYGLTFSFYLAREYTEAKKMARYMMHLDSQDPMVLGLAAETLVKSGDVVDGLDIFERALADFPNRLPLVIGYAKALMDSGSPLKAVDFLDKQIFKYRNESRLFELQSKGYALTGNELLQHRAQAEAYYHKGELSSAIEQLEIAKLNGEGNFFEKSSLDARLKQFIKLREDLKSR